MEEIIKDKKKIRIYFSLLVTVICIIGVSYAFFQLFLKQSEIILLYQGLVLILV